MKNPGGGLWILRKSASSLDSSSVSLWSLALAIRYELPGLGPLPEGVLVTSSVHRSGGGVGAGHTALRRRWSADAVADEDPGRQRARRRTATGVPASESCRSPTASRCWSSPCPPALRSHSPPGLVNVLTTYLKTQARDGHDARLPQRPVPARAAAVAGVPRPAAVGDADLRHQLPGRRAGERGDERCCRWRRAS